ncbi:putative uridine nucleosidase 2 [Hypsibius exemplaris]|uniref:Uridine nucleosidase 2 n=1 Tax=Hypsibius exemplaris TaxID=2072580 RepID=A0A1W0WAQ9_HYPEX|nr:putative uridine nucleosidase 2 [Hypsibius exemplaris]
MAARLNDGLRRKVIIDTDVGIDDAQAILLMLMDPSVDVIGVTCVGGNATLENVCLNVLKVLTVAGRLDIPVFRGCKAAIIGNIKYGIEYHGADGLGDCDPAVLSLPVDPTIIQPEHATSALIRLAKQYPGEVSVICLGPLTNLAIAIKIDPDYTQLLKAVYIMGGNHAGEVVLVGWEVSSSPLSRFDPEWEREYFNQTTPQGLFTTRIHEKARARAQANEANESGGIVMCDEWVAALFLDPAVCLESKVWPTTVELSGKLTRGQCVVDKRFYCNKAQGKSNVRHVLRLDVERMKVLLMAMVQAPFFPTAPTKT